MPQHIAIFVKQVIIISVLVVGSMLLIAEPALAQASPMEQVLCYIIGIIYGNFGRGLAVLAVIAVGVGAALGKASWGLAITVAVGIGLIFGAVPLMAYIMQNMNNAIAICPSGYGPPG